jgi:hypothetical protein
VGQFRRANSIVGDAQIKGDLIGVRISVAEDEDRQDPWTTLPSGKRKGRPIEGPFPKNVQIVRANLIYVEKKDLPPAILNRLLRIAAFQNPEFYKSQAMRLSTYDKPRVIACGEDFEKHVAVPRGCLAKVLALFEGHKIRPELRDELSAFTFAQVMKQVKAKYVVGLTATPMRKDGHHPIIYMQCGPVRFNMSPRTMTNSNPFEHKMTPRHTEFRVAPELTDATIQDLYAALVRDAQRNEMIANDVAQAVGAGPLPIALDGTDGTSRLFRESACWGRQACLRSQRRYGQEAASCTRGSDGSCPGERVSRDSRNGKLHRRRI